MTCVTAHGFPPTCAHASASEATLARACRVRVRPNYPPRPPSADCRVARVSAASTYGHGPRRECTGKLCVTHEHARARARIADRNPLNNEVKKAKSQTGTRAPAGDNQVGKNQNLLPMRVAGVTGGSRAALRRAQPCDPAPARLDRPVPPGRSLQPEGGTSPSRLTPPSP